MISYFSIILNSICIVHLNPFVQNKRCVEYCICMAFSNKLSCKHYKPIGASSTQAGGHCEKAQRPGAALTRQSAGMEGDWDFKIGRSVYLGHVYPMKTVHASWGSQPQENATVSYICCFNKGISKGHLCLQAFCIHNKQLRWITSIG